MPLEITLIALPFLTAFIVSLIFAPGTIDMLKRRNVGQTISSDGPESHKPKEGTPTMGGMIILAGILGGVLVACIAINNPKLGGMLSSGPVTAVYDLLAVLFLMLAYSLLGMVDDYLTIHPVKGVRGIASKPKAAAQILIAIAFVSWLAVNRPEPLTPYLSFMGMPILSEIFYWIFAVVFIAGMANFVNITDGLDGLISGLTAIAAVAFVCVIALVPDHKGFDSSGLIALSMAIAGACVAFLWFNTNPAKVFMGDTGSLALGVALPAIAIVTHREILMIIIGLVFIMDGLSTMIQWAVFKYTRITTGTGRRVFKKSPIHHHFEMCGWAEQAIVTRFWIMGVIAAVIAFAGAAWRLW